MNIKDEAVELKPCPFCASRVLNQFKDDDNHIIECAQCGCEIANTIAWKAIAAWNRRQSPAGVGVKPLEWKPIGPADSDIEAETELGTYVISVDSVVAGRTHYLWVAGQGESEEHHSDYTSMAEAKAAAQADYERRILSAIEPAQAQGEGDDETYEIGKREGYEEAVQDIDRLTGGDGEYRYCTDGDPERHTPDAATMKLRIADRFTALRAERERLERALSQIATGSISGEPGNYRDTVSIMRDIAREAMGGNDGR